MQDKPKKGDLCQDNKRYTARRPRWTLCEYLGHIKRSKKKKCTDEVDMGEGALCPPPSWGMHCHM